MKHISVLISAVVLVAAAVIAVFMLLPNASIEDHSWTFYRYERLEDNEMVTGHFDIRVENGMITLTDNITDAVFVYEYSEVEASRQTSVYELTSGTSEVFAAVVKTKEYDADFVGQTAVIRTDDGRFGGSFSIPNRDGNLLIIVADGCAMYFTDGSVMYYSN